MNIYMKVALLLILFSGYTIADVLILERIQQSKSINTPARGSTMSTVLKEFGEPNLKKNAVGNPPITVWQYDNFSVYFENKWVINSVILKSSAEEKGPKPVSN